MEALAKVYIDIPTRMLTVALFIKLKTEDKPNV